MVPDAKDLNMRFLLVVSHVVVDRHTYYHIYNMLGATAPAVSLSPECCPCIETEDVPAQMGGIAESWLASRLLRILLHVPSTYLKPRLFAVDFGTHKVNTKHVRTIKAHQVGRYGRYVLFVSTNNVVTSKMMNPARPDVGAMAVKF